MDKSVQQAQDILHALHDVSLIQIHVNNNNNDNDLTARSTTTTNKRTLQRKCYLINTLMHMFLKRTVIEQGEKIVSD